MKLDARIKSISDILTCFDIEESKQYIGQKGYFVGYISSYQNLGNRAYGTLTEIKDSDCPFKMDNNEYWCFFIPESREKGGIMTASLLVLLPAIELGLSVLMYV